MKISEGVSEVLEEHYTYKYILTIIKSIYGIVQAAHFLFKEYINTMNLKVVLKQYKTGTCLLCRFN